jgi:hypothetical protein
MQRLVDQKVISRTLTNDPEVVYESVVRLTVLKRTFEALLCYASGLILKTSSLAGTADALWLKVIVARTLLPFLVNEINVCSEPIRSTISPLPPSAQGIKTVRLMSVLSFTVTAALTGMINDDSTAKQINTLRILCFSFAGVSVSVSRCANNYARFSPQSLLYTPPT